MALSTLVSRSPSSIDEILDTLDINSFEYKFEKCITVWCFQFYLVHLGTEVLNGTWEQRLLNDFGTSSYTQPRSIIGKCNFCRCIGTSLFPSVKFCTTLKILGKEICDKSMTLFFFWNFFSQKNLVKLPNSIHGSSREPKKKDAQKKSFLIF
jgi:hypothetical protein